MAYNVWQVAISRVCIAPTPHLHRTHIASSPPQTRTHTATTSHLHRTTFGARAMHVRSSGGVNAATYFAYLRISLSLSEFLWTLRDFARITSHLSLSSCNTNTIMYSSPWRAPTSPCIYLSRPQPIPRKL